MNNRHLLTLAIIIVLSFAANWFIETAEKDQESIAVPQDVPDSYMINATITQFNRSGTIQHIIAAKEFVHYSLSDVTHLTNPDIQLFETESSVPWDIRSEKGEIQPKTKKLPETLELWGTVLAQIAYSEGEYIELEAERMRIVPDKHIVEALSDIELRNEIGVTIAGGLIAQLDKEKYDLFSSTETRVSSTFRPNNASP